jgi:hypothetical protein
MCDDRRAAGGPDVLSQSAAPSQAGQNENCRKKKCPVLLDRYRVELLIFFSGGSSAISNRRFGVSVSAGMLEIIGWAICWEGTGWQIIGL